MKANRICLLALTLTIMPASAAQVELIGLSNTDWASPDTSGGSFVNNTVISVDGVVVGNRAGAPVVGDGSNTATLDITTFIANNSSSPGTLAYSVGGLDLDGVGGNNDSFVLTFSVSTDGQNLQTPWGGTEPTNAGWLSSGGDVLNASGEYVQFDFSSLLVNLNGETGNGSGTFDGFAEVKVGSWNTGDAAIVNGATITYAGSGENVVDLTPGGLDTNLRVQRSGGDVRPDYFGVQLTVIPEPSTALLAAFGLMVMLSRRRR